MSYVKGRWNALCERCGFSFKSHKLKREWNGLRTCSGAGTNNCWEPRQPQDHVRGRADRQSPPWVSPDSSGVDVSPGSGNEVTRDDL